MSASVSPDRLRDFSARFQGQCIQPGAATYDSARAVWNGMIDRRPACIAQCRTTADVQEALRFAQENSLAVAVRGGGHNAAGLGVCDGGLVIDLRGMRDIVVDAARKTVRAGGGATWGDLDAATAPHGLATTGGVISTTGIAGLTLGGGLGWLMRSYGMACDNLIGADVVTADGRALHASESENADLLFALRGGGGNFGVVTTLEFQLHEVSTVFGGALFWPLARAGDVLRLYRDVARGAPDALTIFAGMMHSPEGIPVVALVLCYNGSAEDGEAAIKAIRAFDPPVAGGVGPMPYGALQGMLDAGFPSGLQVHWRSEFLRDLPDELLDALVARYQDVRSPLSALLIEQFGGAVRQIPNESAAFDQRDAEFNLVIISRWADPSVADVNVVWARETSEAAKPFGTGRVYVNYIGAGEAPDRVRASFSPEKFARLSAIKSTYDPHNVFRSNQNIPPG